MVFFRRCLAEVPVFLDLFFFLSPQLPPPPRPIPSLSGHDYVTLRGPGGTNERIHWSVYIFIKLSSRQLLVHKLWYLGKHIVAK